MKSAEAWVLRDSPSLPGKLQATSPFPYHSKSARTSSLSQDTRVFRWTVRTLSCGLLENDLVDEVNLLIVPVVVGQGTRLFPDTGPDIALDLVESRAFPKGITIQVYRPTGRPQYAA